MPKRIIHIWASAGGDVDTRASSTSQPAVGAIGRRAGTRSRRFEPSTRRLASAFVRAIDPFRPATWRPSPGSPPSFAFPSGRCVSVFFFFSDAFTSAEVSCLEVRASSSRARRSHSSPRTPPARAMPRARSRSLAFALAASCLAVAARRGDTRRGALRVAVRVPRPGGFFCARRPRASRARRRRGDVAARVPRAGARVGDSPGDSPAVSSRRLRAASAASSARAAARRSRASCSSAPVRRRRRCASSRRSRARPPARYGAAWTSPR